MAVVLDGTGIVEHPQAHSSRRRLSPEHVRDAADHGVGSRGVPAPAFDVEQERDYKPRVRVHACGQCAAHRRTRSCTSRSNAAPSRSTPRTPRSCRELAAQRPSGRSRRSRARSAARAKLFSQMTPASGETPRPPTPGPPAVPSGNFPTSAASCMRRDLPPWHRTICSARSPLVPRSSNLTYRRHWSSALWTNSCQSMSSTSLRCMQRRIHWPPRARGTCRLKRGPAHHASEPRP